MTASFRLRHVAQINPPTAEFDRLLADAEVTFLPLEAVWPGHRLDTTRVRAKSQVAVGYTRFKDGDVLVPKITPTFEADRSAIARDLIQGVGAGTTELHVVRPLPGADNRYVRYLLSSRPFLMGGEAEMIGVAGQKRVPDNWLRDLPVPVVDRGMQSAIADFLDCETIRIDALILKKKRLINLVQQRFWADLASSIYSTKAPIVPLNRAFVSIKDGPFGSAFSSADYAVSGAKVVRLGNIGFAEYRHHDQAFIDLGLYATFRRYQILPGDILIAGLGDAVNHPGRACVAPELGPAIVKGKCFCARPNLSRVTPEYIAFFLSSPSGAEIMSSSARGSTRSMINLEIVKSTCVPLPDLDTQNHIVKVASRARERTRGAISVLQRQISLLQEHRQALITAAVTGEMEIPEGVAG